MTANGPYIITTTRALDSNPHTRLVSRRAVATLEGVDYCRVHGRRPDYETRCGLCGASFEHERGAKNIASQVVFEHAETTMQPWLTQLADLPESGGTVGPLPDGTVIEVERVNSWDLANTGVGGDTLAAILDAYNAKQEADRAR